RPEQWLGPSLPATAPPPPAQWRARRSRRAPAGYGTSSGDVAEAPLAPLVVEDSVEQVAPGDVGPEHGRHVQLGVGELPQEEVRDAQLARGANQQIRIAPGSSVELLAHSVFIDVLEPSRALQDFLGEQPRRPRQLGARRVGDAQVERQLPTAAGGTLHLVN